MPEYFYDDKPIDGYNGPVFALQPLPGGSPVDFFWISEGVWNTQADGLGQAKEDWTAENPEYFYFWIYEQNGSNINARPEPGFRSKMYEQFDIANADIQTFMQVTIPGLGTVGWSSSVGSSLYITEE
jgi:hypothetical protein